MKLQELNQVESAIQKIAFSTMTHAEMVKLARTTYKQIQWDKIVSFARTVPNAVRVEMSIDGHGFRVYYDGIHSDEFCARTFKKVN